MQKKSFRYLLPLEYNERTWQTDRPLRTYIAIGEIACQQCRLIIIISNNLKNITYDRWRHVTLKGQGHDPKIFEAQYLGNHARYRVGVNGPPIGNHPLRVLWSRDRWRHVTQHVATLVPLLTNKVFECQKNVLLQNRARQSDRYLVPQNVFLHVVTKCRQYVFRFWEDPPSMMSRCAARYMPMIV